MSSDRAVCWNLNNIEFIDIPELSGFSACCTSHTSQLVIHTEVVLKGDGCKSLGCSFHLNMFLSLDSLVKTVTPATPLHNTSGLFINNLNFAIHNDIFVVFIKHGVGLQQLLKRMHTFALNAIVRHQLILLVYFFLIRKILLAFKVRQLRGDIRQYEQVFAPCLLCQPCCTFIC